MRVRTLCLLGAMAMTTAAQAQMSCDTGCGSVPSMGAETCGPGQPCYRFNAQAPWLHGFSGRTTSYAGHSSFRPSNYRQASARARWMQSVGLTHSSSFWSRYANPPYAGVSRKHGLEFTERAPLPIGAMSRRTPQLVDRDSRLENGEMTPIRSVLIATPVRLEELAREAPSEMSEPAEVIRAVQEEDSGPLFPLPVR